MSGQLDSLLKFLREALIEPLRRLGAVLVQAIRALLAAMYRRRRVLAILALIIALAYYLYLCPPFDTARRGEVLVRSNALDGSAAAYTGGTVLVLPGIHQIRRYPTRDQVYRPTESASATGPAPFQSNEGLSIGVELTVRWAIDRTRVAQMSSEAVRRVTITEADAPELLAVLRFLRESPGSEALGISYGAAYLKAVPARALTAEPFDVSPSV